MEDFLSHGSRVAIGQLRVSSHRLEIETGRAARIPREERVCRLCREEVESEEHYVCRCRAYTAIRERYPILFREPHSLRQIFEAADQRILGRFILDIQRHRETSLQAQTAPKGGRQTQITTFFQRSTPLPAPTQQGITLQRAQTLRARRRQRTPGFRTPRLYQREMTEIRAQFHREGAERLARFRADPGMFFRELWTPPSLMYTILHPQYGTGWS